MKNNFLPLIFLFSFVSINLTAQYEFTEDLKIKSTNIKNQQRTGTCWSFATSSFIESELWKQEKYYDISEMYIVRKVYENKALNYILRQGKANFSQGSLSHDLIRTVVNEGMLMESDYPGRDDGAKYDHNELEQVLKGMLDGVLAAKRPSDKWQDAFNAVLDVYLGEVPKQFTVDQQKHTASSFSKNIGLEYSDYLSLTSFTHHPFYQSFILEIPDNYSNGAYYNVPLETLKSIVDHALELGYTIAWDGDVSEDGFSHKNGIAILPVDEKREDLFTSPGEEINADQSKRQRQFENFSTTDDHLMHLIGTAKDKNGSNYYIIKNSWGESNSFGGYLYMSESYFLMKTVSIMLNKNALDHRLKERIFANN